MSDSTVQPILKEILYPCVRVRTGEAGGSGTAIYAKQNAKGDYENYVVTCWHVIQDAITIQEKWDALLGRMRKIETRAMVKVEFFKYEYDIPSIGTHGVEAEIKMHDKDHDVALLRLKQVSSPMEHVAKLFTKADTKQIQLLDDTIAVGCSLGHPPLITKGKITSMSDMIEGMSYWMSDAQIVFGNSGGGMFHSSDNSFIGIPSRVGIVGWSSPITHMGYFTDIERLYKLLEQWKYQFIFDSSVTFEECEKMREKLRREDLELQKRGFIEEEK